MHPYVAEFVGTALLLLLGNGVVANVLLNESKGRNAGWLVICAGWGVAVFVAVFVSGPFSGAHINPAVTLGVATAGRFEWPLVPGYLVAQLLGAMTGAALAYIAYHQHYRQTDDPDLKLATFCTAPAMRTPGWNYVTEVIATFVLVFAVLSLTEPEIQLESATQKVGLGSLGALPVGLIVFGIGMSLGGPTGYAINPARDLAPRIVHALLPIPGKRDSDWSYAAIPVLGPLTGALLAALASWPIPAD